MDSPPSQGAELTKSERIEMVDGFDHGGPPAVDGGGGGDSAVCLEPAGAFRGKSVSDDGSIKGPTKKTSSGNMMTVAPSSMQTIRLASGSRGTSIRSLPSFSEKGVGTRRVKWGHVRGVLGGGGGDTPNAHPRPTGRGNERNMSAFVGTLGTVVWVRLFRVGPVRGMLTTLRNAQLFSSCHHVSRALTHSTTRIHHAPHTEHRAPSTTPHSPRPASPPGVLQEVNLRNPGR